MDDAPIQAGMLLAQLSLFSIDDAQEIVPLGQPYLMTSDGQWRKFDLPRYGFGVPTFKELSMTISSGGRDVAFADPSGLVTVDLRDGSFERFDLPFEAIGLEWSSDKSVLLVKDRNDGRQPCGPNGCALDVSTGRLSKVPFNLFYSAQADRDVVFELKNATRTEPARVTTHRESDEPTAVPLRHLTSVSTAGGPTAAREVAYSQCASSPPAMGSGVVVLDPASGHPISMLESVRSKECSLGALAWLNDRQLLVDEWTRGHMWLWDVTRRRVRQVVVGRTTGVNYSVANEVIARRVG